jgi:hypothetical protein
MSNAVPYVSQAIVEARRVTRPAETAFLAGLAKIVGDMSGLTPGDDEFDYFIPIPASRLHELSQHVADLQLAVQDRYGVTITALPIPVAA